MSENRREKSHRLKTFDAQSFIDTPPVFSCPTSVPRQKSLLANFTSGGRPSPFPSGLARHGDRYTCAITMASNLLYCGHWLKCSGQELPAHGQEEA